MKMMVFACVAAVGLLAAEPVGADAVYKRSRWASKLTKGQLSIQGSGYGSWGKRWITVASGVESYVEAGTSKGAVLIYKMARGNQWHAVQLNYATGATSNRRSFSKPVTLLHAGRYGVLIRVDRTCYDYSWRQLRRIDCKSARYK